MNTLQLVFYVCSIVEGGGCHPLSPIILKEDVSMLGCLIAGAQEGAKYASEHPNVRVSKYVCEPVGRFARS